MIFLLGEDKHHVRCSPGTQEDGYAGQDRPQGKLGDTAQQVTDVAAAGGDRAKTHQQAASKGLQHDKGFGSTEFELFGDQGSDQSANHDTDDQHTEPVEGITV